MDTQRRFAELDYVRAVSLLGVIAVHITAPFILDPSTDKVSLWVSLFFNEISRFCVPAFLFVSGLLACRSLRSGRMRDWLGKRIGDLLLPYAAWTLIGLLTMQGLSSVSAGKVAAIFLTGSGPFYQLYYIPVLFQLYLLFPLIHGVIEKKPGLSLIFLLTVLALAWNERLMLMDGAAALSRVKQLDFYLLVTCFSWIFYFAVGVVASVYYEKLLAYIDSRAGWKFVTAYLAAAVLLFLDCLVNVEVAGGERLGMFVGFFRPSVLLYSLACIFLLMKLGRNSRRSVWAGRLYQNSFGIYLCHIGIIQLLRELSPVFFSNIYWAAVCYMLTLGVSFGLIEGIRKTPLAPVLLGWKKGRQRPVQVERKGWLA